MTPNLNKPESSGVGNVVDGQSNADLQDCDTPTYVLAALPYFGHGPQMYEVKRALTFRKDDADGETITLAPGAVVQAVGLSAVNPPNERAELERAVRKYDSDPSNHSSHLVVFEYAGRYRLASAASSPYGHSALCADVWWDAYEPSFDADLDHLQITGTADGAGERTKVRARFARREGRAHASNTWGPRHSARAKTVETLDAASVEEKRWIREQAPREQERQSEPCERCGGSGHISGYEHVQAGQCFRCHGNGREPGGKKRKPGGGPGGAKSPPAHAADQRARARYIDGPMAGKVVVDVERVAVRVAGCCATYTVSATSGGEQGSHRIAPQRCDSVHVCAACANQLAARKARMVRQLTKQRKGQLVMITLTHRDLPPGAETLREAWGRFDKAYRIMFRGKHKRWAKQNILAAVFNEETTGGSTGTTWHPHVHAILEVPADLAINTFRDELASRWEACTIAAVSAEIVEKMGRPAAELGWMRASGTQAGKERWCELIAGAPVPDWDDPAEEKLITDKCFQICKYASPLCDLKDPQRMAQFVVWSHGRKTTRWFGSWSGNSAQGKAQREQATADLQDASAKAREDAEKDGWAPKVGVPLPGAPPLSSTDARYDADTQILRRWYAMAGEHRRILDGPLQQPITDLEVRIAQASAGWRANDPDRWEQADRIQGLLAERDNLSAVKAGIERRMMDLRTRTDCIAAIEEWEEWKYEDSLVHYDEGSLNRWYKARDGERRKPKKRSGK